MDVECQARPPAAGQDGLQGQEHLAAEQDEDTQGEALTAFHHQWALQQAAQLLLQSALAVACLQVLAAAAKSGLSSADTQGEAVDQNALPWRG